MKLYELVGCDKTQGFSPYVWPTRMALAHKGLKVEMVPLIFAQMPELSQSKGLDTKTVPILEHNGKCISDSWDIACYLEDNFPDKPSLFGGEAGKSYAKFANFVSFHNLLMPLFNTLAYDIYDIVDEKDRDYFRSSREAILGKTLEEARENRAETLVAFKEQLWPYNKLLKSQDFLSGDGPMYADYVLYGLFQWAKVVSSTQILDPEEPLYAWRNRMDNLYNGLGKVVHQKN